MTELFNLSSLNLSTYISPSIIAIHTECIAAAPIGTVNMSSSSTVTAPTKRKLRPARKQVAPDEIDRSEKIQAGKEYSMFIYL